MKLCLQCTILSVSGENDEEFDIPKKIQTNKQTKQIYSQLCSEQLVSIKH
jgi:hypothetical protein